MEWFAPVAIEHRSQRAQVAAQATGRDPGLVNRLVVVAEPDHGIEREQLLQASNERGPHEVFDARLAPEREAVGDVGWLGRGRAQHACDLRFGARRFGAGRAERAHDVVEERIRCLLRELDLDLAEARATGDRGRARHRVVVDLGQQTASLVEQECLATTRVDRRDLHEWSGPGPWPHQARGRSRRRARVTRERVLGARRCSTRSSTREV